MNFEPKRKQTSSQKTKELGVWHQNKHLLIQKMSTGISLKGYVETQRKMMFIPRKQYITVEEQAI